MSVQPVIESGAVIDIPLNKLKKSPKNARKTPHAEAAIEALAASIAAKGMLQAPVVEPEVGEDGEPTGFWLVTIGEGRRLAMLLRAKRKEVRKAEPVRCVVDTSSPLVRGAFAQTMQKRREERRRLFQKLELEFIELRAGEEYQNALARFFKARSRRRAA